MDTEISISSCAMSHYSLPQLPLEILGHIGTFLPFQARLEFAGVNSQMRQLLAPDLFARIRATNREEDGKAIQSILSKYGQYARGLRFQCYLYPNPLCEASVRMPMRPPENEMLCILPDEGAKLLAGKILGQLRALTIEFVIQDELGSGAYWDVDGNIWDHQDDIESEDDILQKEQDWRWRKVMFQVWDAVSTNPTIRDLKISNLPPRKTSTWGTSKWRSFLLQLEKLSVGLWGDDNGACWHANTMSIYLDFLTRLDNYFFTHASNLNHLEIVAEKGNPYGCDGYHHAPLALHPQQLPKLKVLKLRNCVIDPNLVRFLETHSKTLQRLILAECTSCVDDGLTDDEVSWADFFKKLHASEPALELFLLINKKIALTRDEQFPEWPHLDASGNFVAPDDEPENVKTIRKAVETDERRLFSYSCLDDKYGMVFQLEDVNVLRFEAGDDQREYDKLMEVVERNASTNVQAPSAGESWRKLEWNSV